MWFEATKAGEYRFFCAEYCGTQHSGMIGRVIVMEPPDFEKWLSGGATGSLDGAAGREAFRESGLRQLSPTGRRRAGALAGGPLRQTR